jgi:Holliday junction DNA helicase RuvA
MLSAIRGKLFDINPGETFIETSGGMIVKVLCPVSSYSEIKKTKDVFLYTTLKHKDEDLILYGFLKKKERYFFEKLISISGVGGKTALSIISSFSIDEIMLAVESSDVVKISSVPGIGKKTAQRIILELSGKIIFNEEEVNESVKIKDDLISGLVNLGYSVKNVKKVVNEVLKDYDENVSFESYFKRVLKKISR